MDRDERRAWGPLIREARVAHGLSQDELADQAATTRRTIGSIERGKTVPQKEVLERILLVLGIRAPRQLDGDVRAFLAMLGPLLQRLTPEERADVMPELVRLVTPPPDDDRNAHRRGA